MINEFGDEITSEDVEEIADKVREMSFEEIDLLWFKCGVIDKDKGGNKALPSFEIEKIKSSEGFARKEVHDLLMNVPFGEFMEFLADLE